MSIHYSNVVQRGPLSAVTHGVFTLSAHVNIHGISYVSLEEILTFLLVMPIPVAKRVS